jgi:hypothetical protein
VPRLSECEAGAILHELNGSVHMGVRISITNWNKVYRLRMTEKKAIMKILEAKSDKVSREFVQILLVCWTASVV